MTGSNTQTFTWENVVPELCETKTINNFEICKKKKNIVIIIIMIINYLLSNLLKYVTSVIYSKPNPDLFLNITK